MDKKQEWLNTKPHHHTVLSDIRSNEYVQLLDKKEDIQDSVEVIDAKNNLNKDYNVENIFTLVEALNKQLRYRESLEYLYKALEIEPNNFKIKRMIAIRLLTTNQVDKAYDLFLELEKESYDKLDINYRLGLCQFYLGKYDKALDYFTLALEYSLNNVEMYIACIYWQLLSAVQLGKVLSPILEKYNSPFVPHHAGYEYAIRLFVGDKPEEFESISLSDNLTRIMYLFGLYHYYIFIKDEINEKKTFDECLKCNEYWASFSGLGAWYIYLKD